MESLQSLKNTLVTVECFGGQTAQMIVVEDLGDILVVCTEQEFDAASAAGREPSTIGFRRSSVLNVDR